jgi:hypothetical protein
VSRPGLTAAKHLLTYVNVINIKIGTRMVIAARRVNPGPLLGLGVTVLGFALWWPIGLAALAFFLWSRTMGCGHHRRMHDWHERGVEEFCSFAGWRRGHRRAAPSTGNRAFDDYRAETLRRLEDDQKQFAEFLDHLRRAKDQAEFEQFMADRATRRDDRETPAQA